MSKPCRPAGSPITPSSCGSRVRGNGSRKASSSGIAGAVLVFGSESHRLIGEGGAAAFTQSAGFNGIVAALFGGLHPLFTIPAAFFFGGMLTGGIALQQELQVPAALIVALNGVVVIFVVSSLKLRQRLNAWVDSYAPEAEP